MSETHAVSGGAPKPLLFLRRIASFSDERRLPVVVVAASLVSLIAFADYEVKPNVSLGYLYMLPVLVSAGALRRWQLVLLAAVCAVLRERLGPFDDDDFFWTREVLVFVAFACSGLLTKELIERRRRSDEYSARLEAEIKLRRDAEEQLRILVESNPAAIFTVDSKLNILLANGAAGRLLGCPVDELAKRNLAEFLPDLRRVPLDSGKRFFRTNMECTGRRADGSLWAADVWFSTYGTAGGQRLAAIVLDLTEERREREGVGLDSLLATSRVLVGAVLHEVRNLSAAASVAHSNLGRSPGVSDSEDFRVLGALVEGLERTASAELAELSHRESAATDIAAVVNELHLIVEPALEEADATLDVRIPAGVLARIDHHSLLQVLLNLWRNSLRAVETSLRREIRVDCTTEDDTVLVRFQDTGAGVREPDQLFQPFRSASQATGLGLYVSRAIVRSFGGELFHQPTSSGALFVIRLRRAQPSRNNVATRGVANHEPIEPNATAQDAADQRADHRRPQPVSAGTDSSAGG
ncbi:MAG: PAS domain S-box protein [Acidobacteria bacterium]|nr:PAS domain S-box protein [Acidobacteriota bacterium]